MRFIVKNMKCKDCGTVDEYTIVIKDDVNHNVDMNLLSCKNCQSYNLEDAPTATRMKPKVK